MIEPFKHKLVNFISLMNIFSKDLEIGSVTDVSVSSPPTIGISKVIDVARDDNESGKGPRATLRLKSIVVLYEQHELGKAILGFAIPVTTGLLSLHKEANPLVVRLVVISLCIGFVCIWNGLLLRDIIEDRARRVEQLGVALVAAAFCGLVSTFLHDSLVWVPWVCWALFLLPFLLTFL